MKAAKGFGRRRIFVGGGDSASTASTRGAGWEATFCELAHDYCLLGAANVELAEYFEVVPRTIDNWIASPPAFADAVRVGRVVADARVARSRYERAVGYSCTVERKVLHEGKERTLKNVVHYPPDTRACIFWLRNRRRDAWSEKRAAGPDDGSGGDFVADSATASMSPATGCYCRAVRDS